MWKVEIEFSNGDCAIYTCEDYSEALGYYESSLKDEDAVKSVLKMKQKILFSK